jgi:hypothetical protein
MKLLEIVIVDFDIMDQLLIRFLCIHQTMERKQECNETVR